MRKFILIVLSFTLLTSCLKEDVFKDYTEENEQEILAYLADNNLSATKDNYGLYTVFEDDGAGLKPELEDNDIVTINYTGSFTNGEVFDENNTGEFQVNMQRLMDGLSIGISSIREGGKAKFIIPSRLGYGSVDYDGIAAGSVLVFDIELISVNYNKENDIEITEYLAENELTDVATKTDSGLYYIIEEETAGSSPTSLDKVIVSYNGYYSDDVTFDERSDQEIDLQNVIQGWKEGISKFKVGEKGKLFIPSRLGYNNGRVLIFDIHLISIATE